MISCVIKLYLGVFIAQECQQHMMVCPKHGDAYVIRWRTGKTKCCVSTEVAGHETKSNKTEEISGWTTVIFKNRPACSSLIGLVKPIHVHLFHFLVIFVSDQVHNQDKYLNVF